MNQFKNDLQNLNTDAFQVSGMTPNAGQGQVQVDPRLCIGFGFCIGFCSCGGCGGCGNCSNCFRCGGCGGFRCGGCARCAGCARCR